jgi:ATP-binding cassette subfamily F protein 3
MLEKLERIPEPEADSLGIHFRFPPPERSARAVVALTRFSKTYESPDRRVEVFHDAGPLAIERGQKVALIGRNAINLFAQHTADTLDTSDTVLEAVQRAATGQTESELRSLLGAFLFRGDDVFKPVRVLSGGEKSRVALARTMVTPANLLILDEPTNHLDIRSIAVLIEALRQFEGTFAVVSHDRHFLDQVAHTVWRVEDGRVEEYPGTYSEFRWRQEQRAGFAADGRPRPSGKASNTNQTVAAPDTRPAAHADSGMAPGARKPKRGPVEPANGRPDTANSASDNPFRALNDFKLRKAHAKAESDVAEAEERKSTLEAQLGDPTLYADETAALEATRAYESACSELETLYQTWEAVADVVAERQRS